MPQPVHELKLALWGGTHIVLSQDAASGNLGQNLTRT